MNANDVIECYVTDVALQVPRKQRNSVAFELRSLLNEGLQDKSEAAGRAADADMAIDFVRAFGRPDDVAARYRPALTIIDPADGHGFLRASVIGLLIIWSLGLVEALGQPMESTDQVIRAFTHWWGKAVIPSLWWPGVLVVGYGLGTGARRRWPTSSEWKPKAEDHITGGRVGLVMAILGIVCGVFVLMDPRWVLDFFWGGNAAPAAYEAMTYTDTFRQRQGPILFVLLLLNLPLMIVAIVQGRHSPLLRRVETGHALVLCAVLAWTLLDGPVMGTKVSDQTFKGGVFLILVFTLIGYAVQRYRSVRPMPN